MDKPGGWDFLKKTKGQLILKGLFSIVNSPKTRTKQFDFSTMIPQVDLFSFVFGEKLKTPKRHFEIKWPLLVKAILSVCSVPINKKVYRILNIYNVGTNAANTT